MPLVAAHLAWWLSLHDGLVPACNPYIEGCVSISRAARHGMGNPLFRMLMLPCAMVQVLCWLTAAHWLRRESGARMRALPWLGLVAGASLCLYATFLGSEGDVYRVLRRYGMTIYFGATYLALMALLRVMSRQQPPGAAFRPLRTVAIGMLLIGLTSVATSALVHDPAMRDRWENVLEWHLGLWLTAMFGVLAWRWWRDRLRVKLE